MVCSVLRWYFMLGWMRILVRKLSLLIMKKLLSVCVLCLGTDALGCWLCCMIVALLVLMLENHLMVSA